MTRRLRGIHAAWHFGFAVSFGGEGGLRELGLCGNHPLTQRYVFRGYIVEILGLFDERTTFGDV
ncbi:DUF3265 domain-containing protein [Vibrio vulnificus]